GHNATALVALAWLLAQYNEDPNRFRSHQFSLLWQFKNVLHNAGEFPQIRRQQFEDLRHQMEALYRGCGYNMRPVQGVRLSFALAIGDRPMAEEAHKEFSASP